MNEQHRQGIKSRSQPWNYLLKLLFSLVTLVFLMDFAWQNWVPDKDPETLMPEALFSLVESTLPSTAQENREALPTKFVWDEQVVSVQINPADQAHLQALTQEQMNTIQKIEKDGKIYWAKWSSNLNGLVTLGPVKQSDEGFPQWIHTLVFYLILFVTLWVWIRPVIRALNHLNNGAVNFAEDYTSKFPDIKTNTPVAELSDSFLHMSNRIRALIDTQKELADGLSHELRTPLARIKFALANLGFEELPEKVESQIQSIEEDVKTLDQLITAILEFSRASELYSSGNREQADISHLLSESAEMFRWKTSSTITIDVREGASCICESRLMKIAINNLLDNACRYAKNQIVVSYLQDSDGRHHIRVEDDGEGIPQTDRARALMPFKKDRDPDNAQQNFGLGLAVVKRVALLHFGEVNLYQSELGGLGAEIIWSG